ncbi:sterol desaturase family protein [Curvivirga sp.]|uniref:sterol desaturase family protein n=1 Tax=Curvivirga sp. TaxID=2856848 RepID=UPI003B5A785E
MELGSFTTILWDAISPLFSPQKRIFVGYLAASVPLIILYCLVSRQKIKSFWQSFFSKDIWFSKSARLDYSIFVINRIFMLLMAPILLTKLAVATYLFEEFHVIFNGRPSVAGTLPDWAVSLSFTFLIFLFDDASKYWLHRLMHRNHFLWQFHKIHHDAEKLTPFTVYRIHPVEALLFSVRAVLIQGFVIALFIFFFGLNVTLIDILGANFIIFLFNITGSNLRHSHVRITYGNWLEKLFISPAQHQIHHSNNVRHYDKNFGVVLAIWDWLGGSLVLASSAPEKITFGNKNTSNKIHSLSYAYLAPFQESTKRMIKLLSQTLKKKSVNKSI